MPEYSQSKVGQCDGRKIASLKCKLYASLRPVYFGGGTYWLCGRCINKLMRRRLGNRGIKIVG